MKEKIKVCIDFVRGVSLREPIDFRVEETEKNRVVLSYKEKDEYERIYKEFSLNSAGDKIISMVSFK